MFDWIALQHQRILKNITTERKEDPIMNLKEHLFYRDITVTDLAKTIQVSRGYMSQIMNRRKKPSGKIKKKIEEATGIIL